jgi:hypothetical protein
MRILSLGAGVQSSTLALMAAHGEIEPVEHAIFADTQAEPPSVYKWLDWLETKLPFPVHRVMKGSLTEEALSTKTNRKTGNPYYSNQIPAFVLGADGKEGQTDRRCTYNHKVLPIIRAARRLAKVPRGCKTVVVEQLIGISLDEVRRMKPSREPWSVHRWPLVELRMTRRHCIEWMEKHGYPKPPRSACVYCPYHRDSEWRRLQTEEPEAFAAAVKFERDFQAFHASSNAKGRIKGTPFLHSLRKPLDTIDFRSDEEHGQLNLWDDECEGMCGV